MRSIVLHAALLAAFFAGYAAGVSPGVDWLDAGELTAAGFSLGVSHPPGQPGHALLACLASLLPLGEVAFRVNLLSAVAGVIGLAGVVALCRALLPEEDSRSLPADVTAVAAAALVGLSPLFVEQALRAEVYTPAFALLTWGAVFAVGWIQHTQIASLAASGLCFGLAATLHPLLAAAGGAPLGVAALVRAHKRFPRVAGVGLATGLLGLLTYLYLPLRAAAPARALLVWGQPDSAGRFFDVVRARAYSGNFAADGLGERLGGHLALLVEGTGLALVGMGLVGLDFGAMTRLRGCLPLAFAALLLTAGASAQRVFLADNPDVHGYLIPALAFLAPGLAVTAAALGRLGERSVVGRLAPLALLAPLAILAFVGAEPIHAQGAEPRRRDDALRYHDATLARMPPGPALYLADSDHALFPALYERIVAGARPDVAVASAGLMTSSWFLAMVDREVPELFVPYVDDSGRSDDLAGRLVAENLAAGRPVGGEDFALPGGGVPLGRGYLAGTATPPFEAPSAPPVYEGYLGRRVARRVGLQRAEWELAHGRPLEAARAAGVLDRLDAEMRAGLADAKRPPLAPLLPRVTPIFISAPWQLEILVDDLAQMAGRPPGPPPDGPLERRLLHVWVELLAGKDEARRRLDPLGIEARLATARMFDKLGRPADAAGQLEAVLVDDPRHEGALVLLGMLLANQGRLSDAEARVRAATDAHPKSARPWATLGVILAKQGRMPEAVAAWRRSLELDPEQPDVRAWLASPTP